MPIPEHIRRLREKVGNDLLLVPSVAVVVRDDGGRLLLVHHVDSGRWGLPGGAVEVDEDPAEAAVREVAEETGIDVELTGLLAALGGPGYRVRYDNGDETAYVAVVYAGRVVGGDPRPDGDETLDVGFFALDDLPPLGSFAEAALRELDLG